MTTIKLSKDSMVVPWGIKRGSHKDILLGRNKISGPPLIWDQREYIYSLCLWHNQIFQSGWYKGCLWSASENSLSMPGGSKWHNFGPFKQDFGDPIHFTHAVTVSGPLVQPITIPYVQEVVTPFYIVTFYITWVTTSWTDGISYL